MESNTGLQRSNTSLSPPTQMARLRLANMALMEMTEAINRGWGDRDSRVAMLLQEERAGVEVRVDEAVLKAVLEAEGNA